MFFLKICLVQIKYYFHLYCLVLLNLKIMSQTLETWSVIVSDDCNFGFSASKNEITSCIVFGSWNIIDKNSYTVKQQCLCSIKRVWNSFWVKLAGRRICSTVVRRGELIGKVFPMYLEFERNIYFLPLLKK